MQQNDKKIRLAASIGVLGARDDTNVMKPPADRPALHGLLASEIVHRDAHQTEP
jgi:hypothetical protein